jgi:hypothetical protein
LEPLGESMLRAEEKSASGALRRTSLAFVTYTTAEARQQVLDALAAAADEIALALALLSEAYEHLDEYAAGQLEEQLFQPIQAAYGRAKRVHGAFAERYGLPARALHTPSQIAPSSGTKGLIEAAVEAAGSADGALVELQDSMLPVEVGDAELRAGIAAVRELVGGLRPRAREVMRTLGR